MLLCDAFTRVKPSKDILNVVWMLFHLLGLSANIWAFWLLKKKWNTLGSHKLLLGTSIFSNVFALVVHLYLPINFMLRSVTGLQWSLGSSLCTVLPPIANFALTASILGLLAVAMDNYFKNIHNDEVSSRDAENTTVLVWAIASLLTAPQFCQCGMVSQAYLDAGNCVQGWQYTESGRLYEASRLILQYIIPFAIIGNLFIKVHIYPFGWKNRSKCRRFLSILTDLVTGVFVGAAAYLFPVQTVMASWGRSVNGSPFPDVATVSQVLEFFAVFLCIATPFEFIEILNDEDIKAPCYETDALGEYQPVDQAIKINKGNLSEKIFKEKPSDELLKSLINEEPLRLKNEIIV
ncbi:putative neuropeptide Y receptor type 6 [Actinia tenebrosa]|uniref:Neuropeptide Y receptor type 6 n=1 Tax=Actinia tenebrosa TaxID=6105 RepID=A0A6P8I1P5_ACTTE|nr:putative neuropeptide Y receptor type 6 [Actinia tenebrosa]